MDYEKHYDNGEVGIADGLWAQAVAYGRHISIRQPNTRIQHLVGIGLQAMGRYEEAIDIIEESLLREDDPAYKKGVTASPGQTLYAAQRGALGQPLNR